jgi:hypothetical protein
VFTAQQHRAVRDRINSVRAEKENEQKERHAERESRRIAKVSARKKRSEMAVRKAEATRPPQVAQEKQRRPAQSADFEASSTCGKSASVMW